MKPSVLTGSVAGLLGFSGQSLTSWDYYNTVEPEPELPPPPLGPAELNYQDGSTIKTFQGGICVNSYLNEKEKALLNKSGVTSQDWKHVPNKFKNTSGKAESCVAVSWDKEALQNGLWRGSIRYEWLYKIGDETLVTYGVYNPVEKLMYLTWRAIYINVKTQKTAWNFWYRIKNDIPKSPAFQAGWVWGFEPVYGASCGWPGKDCSNAGVKEKTHGEHKWTWKEDDKGDQLFTAWTRNFWNVFKDFIYDSPQPLTALIELAKREGTWTQR